MLFISILWVPQVKDLENSVAELLNLYIDCNHRSSAIQSVANKYQPGEQVLIYFFFRCYLIAYSVAYF